MLRLVRQNQITIEQNFSSESNIQIVHQSIPQDLREHNSKMLTNPKILGHIENNSEQDKSFHCDEDLMNRSVAINLATKDSDAGSDRIIGLIQTPN